MQSLRQGGPEPLPAPPVRVPMGCQEAVNHAFQVAKAGELGQHLDSEGHGALQALRALREPLVPPILRPNTLAASPAILRMYRFVSTFCRLGSESAVDSVSAARILWQSRQQPWRPSLCLDEFQKQARGRVCEHLGHFLLMPPLQSLGEVGLSG